MDNCIFCRIASGAIPSDIVMADDSFLAFRDINPKAREHVLVIPREHVVSLNDVDRWRDCEGQALLQFVVRTAERLGIAESGYRVLTNVGNDGGQDVQHLHLHVLGGERLGDFR
jgi:histidine triad (HIT) family protein